ncbi:cysteine proteinase [Nadsonia fulvescens var. elongata DSM 6958]|uniref:ubiquitinyl hydrolase 1 n=1 Tax=Nadsonia fulvescens var. elongata DSM 6958 TaxID=857566 RepID=A0A1E3PKJ4_9ASCO|nr:cysteine proteinase [Nadsonia fulvescens var. elongata DSM 6958]
MALNYFSSSLKSIVSASTGAINNLTGGSLSAFISFDDKDAIFDALDESIVEFNTGEDAFSLDQIESPVTVERTVRNAKSIPGIYNSSNFCFMNSVIQTFASLDSLGSFIRNGALVDRSEKGLVKISQIIENDLEVDVEIIDTNVDQQISSTTENPLSRIENLIEKSKLLNLLSMYYENLNKRDSRRQTLRNSHLIESFDAKAKRRWYSFDQEDAQEFFQQLVEAIEKDVLRLRARKGKYISNSDKCEVDTNPSTFKNNESVEDNATTSKMIKKNSLLKLITPFDGITATRIGCTKCKTTDGGIRYETFSGTSLSFPQDVPLDGFVDLYDLIRNYCSMEVIDDVECSHCGLTFLLEDLQKKIDNCDKNISSMEAKSELISSSTGGYMSDSSLVIISEDDDLSNSVDSTPEIITSQDLESEKATPELSQSDDENDLLYHKISSSKQLKSMMVKRYDEISQLLDDLDSPNSEIDEATYTKFIGQRKFKTQKTKQTIFTSPLPPILSFHMNRSIFDINYGLRKSGARVKFPLELDMREFYIDDFYTEEGDLIIDPRYPMVGTASKPLPKYFLKSVICHLGDHNSGHYICFRKTKYYQKGPHALGSAGGKKDTPDGIWWRTSDESVTRASLNSVLDCGRHVFMLVYEVKKEDCETLIPSSEGMCGDNDTGNFTNLQQIINNSQPETGKATKEDLQELSHQASISSSTLINEKISTEVNNTDS